MNPRTFLLESKQAIINIGFPEVVASIFFRVFGKEAYTFARWYREYSGALYPNNKNWFERTGGGALLAKPGIYLLSRLYDTLKAGEVSTHNRLRDIADLADFDPAKTSIEGELISLKEKLEKALLAKSPFFRSNLVEDFRSGKLASLQGYDHLPFAEAEEKYETKTVFSDQEPIKTYPNGWRWINTGGKCVLVGRLMKNCGGTGTSGYSDSQMMVLFDSNNAAHVIVTHIPQINKLTSPEGQASTEVKDEYLPYILDLSRILGAAIRPDTKSKLLNMQQVLGVPLEDFKRIHRDTFNEFFLIKFNGKRYYSDGDYAISTQDYDKVKNLLPRKANTVVEKLKQILGLHNFDTLTDINPEIQVLKIQDLRGSVVSECITLEAILFGAKKTSP